MPQRAENRSADGGAGTAAARAVAISKTYASGAVEVKALREVSLSVPRGRFMGVMGPSGSGKSTLMHCLAGLDAVDSGQVFIGEQEITGLGDKKLTRLRRERVGFIFQSFNLVPTLSALENITLPLGIAGRKPDRDWLDSVIETTGLTGRLHHRPSELSGGQQQRVACARALVGKPEVIFADEPTGNLDSRAGAEVLAFLRESARQMGQSIVMVTHDPIAAGYTDEVVFLADGSLVDRMSQPSAAQVLEFMKSFEPVSAGASGR
ncbi:ABC transporter ATP-binding protein [Streptomyces sp. AK010]|uniref:ABC transporter ATP-binding protein n=1 Tax=Streptomyces sp. AK010 TaxID=2723074 RepID=UPI001608163F|nr:ABC transporter ATP-binding protein [Streptomyces sp. AK010]MBB6421383.1 putative ABC transport system ATP-binding protein [Streptomyces sp. AK010]